ncbi:ABC transporter [Kosmotoga arenicorallina S304]|uniref:ABC transporter n=1 Tax=Kosmotoga arenicorallina S304 TaxID=1453497 RepID=A0A176JYX9_9BACT|nr:ATP-binding cassette domain-containing protein [Kosmotoga arenicorallina]OAA29159.1 ABC transporter [Kosmotoga arenicorallina S304]
MILSFYHKYIEVSNLYKNYTIYKRKRFRREKKIIHAVRDISFAAEKGEFLGYIGPNGAGKSTTIKMLTGILTPSFGEINVAGFCPWIERKKYVKNIGVVFGQKTQMWWDLPVKDTYKVLRAIYSVSEAKFKKQLSFLIDRLEIMEFYEQPVRQLSLGQRMRAELAACMIHDPEILFLDEPTIGLDVVSKHRVLNFLKELNARGKTIFLTTHDLNDIEALCNEILIINHGQLIYKGSLSSLKSKTALPRLLKIRLKESHYSLSETQRNFIRNHNGEFYEKEGEITIRIKNGYNPALLAGEIIKKFEVEDFKIKDPGIEEVVRDIYQSMEFKEAPHKN